MAGSAFASAQDPRIENLWKLYGAGQREEAIAQATALRSADVDQAAVSLLLGRANADEGKYKEAIPYLDFVVTHANKKWDKAWALGYLGTCYFMQERYDESEMALEKAMELNATENATTYAKTKMLLFGFDEFYKSWSVTSSKHFNFHFQNMPAKDMSAFVARAEESFEIINNFFQSELPKKIDFFVWASKEDAKKVLHRDVGFSSPGFCVTHSHFEQTRGHEMTHVISNYSAKIYKRTGLINEGTGVCFDLANRDDQQKVKDWVKSNGKTVSVTDLWTNWNIYPAEVSYPLSGLFVQALIDEFGKPRFIEFFRDQTYENGKLVFGEKLDDVIGEVENSVNR